MTVLYLLLLAAAAVQLALCKTIDLSSMKNNYYKRTDYETSSLPSPSKFEENSSVIRNRRQNFGNGFNDEWDEPKFIWSDSDQPPQRQKQFPDWSGGRNKQNISPKETTKRQTTIKTTTSATPVPRRRPIENDCTRRCFTSPGVFNPVCGTDRITYNNPTRLRCAQSCNINVQFGHQGICIYPGPPVPFPNRD